MRPKTSGSQCFVFYFIKFPSLSREKVMFARRSWIICEALFITSSLFTFLVFERSKDYSLYICLWLR